MLREAGFGQENSPDGLTIGAVDWKTPILFDDVTLPEFPAYTLPEVLREYCGAVCEACQVPFDMTAVSALGAIATALQGKFQIMANSDWIEPLNIYAMFVANPSDMKSPTLKKFTSSIVAYEKEYNKENELKIKDSKNIKDYLENRLKSAKADKKGTLEDVQQAQRELDKHEDFYPIQLTADDITVEALSKIMQENAGRMSIISSEAGLFSSLKGRYTEGIHIDILLKSYNGITDNIRINRVSREPVYIDYPALTILLAAQPQILQELMGESAFRGRGFHARFLYSYPKSKAGSRKIDGIEPITEELKSAYSNFIKELLRIDNKIPVMVNLTPEACNVMVNFRKWLEPQVVEDLEPIADWAGKLHGNALRIAGLLHIASNPIYTTPFAPDNPPVTAQTMENAIAIANYFLEHALYCFGEMGANPIISNAKYILKRLTKEQIAEISKRDILRLCKRFKSVEEITQPLQILEEYGYICLIDNAGVFTGGRHKGDSYMLNPLFFKIS